MFDHYNKKKQEIDQSNVRLQWDPDHDPFGEKIRRKAIQLGLRGDQLIKFNDEYIESIEDITDFVLSQSRLVRDNKLDELEIPYETVYLPSRYELIEKLKIDK